MIKIAARFILYYLKRGARHFYWLYRLSQANFGKGVKLAFPLIIEGKGKIKIGEHCDLGKDVRLGIAESARFEIGNNGQLETKSTILLNKGKKLTIGSGFKLCEGARLFVQQDWIFGDEVKIETHCAIFSREEGYTGVLNIGNGTHIGDNTILDIADDIKIGNDVAIGPNCTLYTHDHDYKNKNLPAWKGDIETKPIIIDDGAWVGSNVTVLPGVHIGKRAVVAAGSVVTKNVEPNSLIGGIPAKLIKAI